MFRRVLACIVNFYRPYPFTTCIKFTDESGIYVLCKKSIFLFDRLIYGLYTENYQLVVTSEGKGKIWIFFEIIYGLMYGEYVLEGYRVPLSHIVRHEFRPGSKASRIWQRAGDARERIARRLGTDDEDPDLLAMVESYEEFRSICAGAAMNDGQALPAPGPARRAEGKKARGTSARGPIKTGTPALRQITQRPGFPVPKLFILSPKARR